MRRQIDTEVGPLAVFDEGGAGPATFFWPSLYVDHRSFDAVVAALRVGRRCVLIDGPGHGASPGAGRRYDLDACARAAIQVLDALQLDSVDWVGNAWGGHVGVCAAASSPSRVRSLVVIGAPMQALSTKLRLQTRLLLGMLRLGLVGQIGRILGSAMLSPQATAAQRAYVVDCVRGATGLAEAVRSISLGRPDLAPLLPRVACPTLFVAGADDAMWPPALAAQQATRLARGRCEVLAGAAHLGPLERPQETVALLKEHWEREDQQR